MSSRKRFLAYLIVLHAGMIGFIFWLDTNPFIVIGMELLLLLSFLLGWWWISRLTQPFRLISTGIENIRSNDFGIQLKQTGQPDFDQLVNVYNSMISRLREERISTSEMNHLLASIIKVSPTGIVLFDFDEVIKAVNPAAEKLLQKKEAELTGRRQSELSTKLAEILYYRQDQWRVIRQNARQIFRVYSGQFMNRGFETRFVLFEEFSKEIYQVEKQSYEKVIRMMGHEVNNTLGPINSVLDTYLQSHQDRFTETFAICRDRNQNLTRFMRRLVEVVRLPNPDQQAIDLVPMIKQTCILVKSRFEDKSIIWELDLPDGAYKVNCDQLQMEQVLINILLNAGEAIDKTGKIRILLEPKKDKLSITNNGKPLSEEVQKNIFTPFFTTKPNGQGVGLTLCREILSRHEFQFMLESIKNGETVFWIKF